MATAPTDPAWAAKLWHCIWSREAQGLLDGGVKALLSGHGYVGQATRSAPCVEELRSGLEALGRVTPASGGVGIGLPPPGLSPPLPQEDGARWHSTLAPSFQRAAGEIYRSIRSHGAVSVRDWLQQNFEGSRRSDSWVDLWTAATGTDFKLDEAYSKR